MEDQNEMKEGRICPVYALAPMRVMGLSSGSAMIALMAFGVGNYTIGAVASTPIAFVIAYISEKVSSGRENGFAVQWVAAHAKGIFAKAIAESWGNLGLMPPPNYQKKFEP